MFTIIALLLFTGCFLLYSTSEKAQLDTNYSIIKWVSKNRKTVKIIGLGLLILALVSNTYVLGLTSGLLYWLFALSLSMGLIVLLYPIKSLTYKFIIPFIIIVFFIEIIFKK